MVDLKRRRGTLVIILLIVCAVSLISLQISGRYGGDFFHSAVLRCISPGQRALDCIIDSLSDLVKSYILLVDLKKENRRLQEELRRLQTENDELRESAEAVERLRHLLFFKSQIPETMTVITAEVIAYSPSAWFRTIVINKGRRDGVQKGMPVVTWEGVVGKVIRTSTGSSVVLLIIDRNSSVDVLVQRTRARGILEGEGTARCQLRYVPKTDDIVVGDRIITSGLGGIFPKGLVMGKVVKVEKKEYGLFQEVVIEPSADFSRLEELMVILKPAEEGKG